MRTIFGKRATARLLFGVMLGLAAVAEVLAAGAKEVKGVVLTVSDLERSVAFFEQALGFTKTAERVTADPAFDTVTGVFGTRVRTATLKLGDETLELDQFLSPSGRSVPADSRSNDLWFQHFAIVVSDMQRAYEHVAKFGVRGISSAPQTLPAWNHAAAGIQAYKFRDHDGHPLELLAFPPDKGHPKWHRPSGKLFLGIDHTAITVTDTERSAKFYRDLLGLRVLGGSLNSGETQEHLDGAFGAVVQVTGLRPDGAAGPGVEFLEYRTPGGGRPVPADAKPTDLAHVRTVIEIDDLDAVAQRLTAAGVSFVSPRVVDTRGLPYLRQLMVKDPDGHAVLLVSR